MVAPPLALVAELTHRCPLACGYCSNPKPLGAPGGELDTSSWGDVFEQAAQFGVLQLHLTGGEPLVRRDLEELVQRARAGSLYVNLITSGVPFDAPRIARLAACGLDAVQLSFQDTDPANAARIAGRDVYSEKLACARAVKESGLALTINVVLHRQNLERVTNFIELAERLGAERLELAHVQYHGWALDNREALLPSAAQLIEARDVVAKARARCAGRLEILHVLPDYYARWPKTCMGGWGRQTLVIAPNGAALPCHHAHSLPGLQFENVRERLLDAIWNHSHAFEAFRGTSWLPEPCQGCERREIDFGGCRCQAFALTGDVNAVDPVCPRSPAHGEVRLARERALTADAPYRLRGRALRVV